MAGSENKSPLGQNARIGAGHAEWSNGCGPPPAPKAKRSSPRHAVCTPYIHGTERGHANDRARSAHRARARARSIRRSKAEILTFPTSSHTYPGDTIQRIPPQPLAGQGDSRPARRCMHPCMHPRMHPRRAQFEEENGSPSRESSLSKTTFWPGSFRSRPIAGDAEGCES